MPLSYVIRLLSAAMMAAATVSTSSDSPAQNSNSVHYDAFAKIARIMFTVVVTQEQCSARYPTMKSEFEVAFTEWKTRNKILDRARDAFFLQARILGGDSEVQRQAGALRADLEPSSEAFANEVRSWSQGQCQISLMAMRQGRYDLSHITSQELRLLQVTP